MRETRTSGSEGGVGFNPPFLPLSEGVGLAVLGGRFESQGLTLL